MNEKQVILYVKFKIGDRVYLVIAEEPMQGMVIGLNVREEHTTYIVAWSDCGESEHYAIELTTEKPVTIE